MNNFKNALIISVMNQAGTEKFSALIISVINDAGTEKLTN